MRKMRRNIKKGERARVKVKEERKKKADKKERNEFRKKRDSVEK